MDNKGPLVFYDNMDFQAHAHSWCSPLKFFSPQEKVDRHPKKVSYSDQVLNRWCPFTPLIHGNNIDA